MSTAAHEPEATESPILSQAFVDDPVGTICHLRDTDPVHFIPGLGAWLVSRFDDVRNLFADERVTPDARFYENFQAPPEGSYMEWLQGNSLFSAPPEQHARQRKLVSKALTPRAVKRMERQVRDVVEQFAIPLHGRHGIVDLNAEFCAPIPNTVICRIMGVPPKGTDEVRFRELMRDIISAISPFLDAEGRKKAEASLNELSTYVRELAVMRRKDPKEDLISDLVLAHDEGDTMTNEEIVLMVAGLVAAGTETTAMASLLGIKNLLENPDQLALLRSKPELMPNAVRELLRYDFGGGTSLPRYAKEDFEFRGKQIKKGQLLMLAFSGAHRDPTMYENPHKLDITRDTRDLVVFGHGPHFCLGANLAQQELSIMFEAALDFLPENARVIEEDLEYFQNMMFRRLENLPIDFGA